MDDQTQRRLSDFREALFAAIEGSQDVREAWSELKDEGYSLHLLLENPQGGPVAAEAGEAVERSVSERPDALFQINGADLSFLRSVGIDPTRRARRGKG